ncbi:unnamed protein product, partial [Didymodactylos carnosus]
TKSELLNALKNEDDPRRYGLLHPIHEWLPNLNEENLTTLLGATSPAKLLRCAVNMGLDCELALHLLNLTQDH